MNNVTSVDSGVVRLGAKTMATDETPQEATAAKIERLYERAITEHVNCKTGDQMRGPCTIDALRDIALRLAKKAKLADEAAPLVAEGLGWVTALKEENARLKAEVERLRAMDIPIYDTRNDMGR